VFSRRSVVCFFRRLTGKARMLQAEGWTAAEIATVVEERDRCCFCSWMPSCITGRSFLQCLSITFSVGALALLIVAIIAAANLGSALDSHDYIYGGSLPLPQGIPTPVAFNPCVFPSISFDNSTGFIPTYLNSSACVSPTSCCPKGYALDGSCYSTTFQCSSFSAKRCLEILEDDTTVIESGGFDFGLIRLLDKEKADWSFVVAFILLPLALLCWGLEIVYWCRRRNAWVGRNIKVSNSEPYHIPHAVVGGVNFFLPNAPLAPIPQKEYSYQCCAAIVIGCVMGAFILTGGLPLVFANKPNIDGVDSLANCFDGSSATIGDPDMLGSMVGCYYGIMLPTIFAGIGMTFALMFQMIYMIPTFYYVMWNWRMFFVIVISTGLIAGGSVAMAFIKQALD